MLGLTLMCLSFLWVNASSELQPQNNPALTISSLVETGKETTMVQCDTSKIKANVELIKSDTTEVLQKVSADLDQLLKDFFICIDPITIGFCIGYVYPSVVLGMIADIPISLVKYLNSVVPLMAEIVQEIIYCSQ